MLHGDAAEEELGLARLVSSYTLPHQNSQPGERDQIEGRQTAVTRTKEVGGGRGAFLAMLPPPPYLNQAFGLA